MNKAITVIPLEEIFVDEERQRKEFTNISELAVSIQSLGQLVPIIVSKEADGLFRLIAGERRLRACYTLNRETIEAIVIDPLDMEDAENKLLLLEMEFAENVQREQLTWQEKAEAITRTHALRVEVHGAASKGHEDATKWTQRKTASKAGVSVGTVNQSLKLVEALEHFPELKDCKTQEQALKKYIDIKSSAISASIAEKASKELNLDTFYNIEAIAGMQQYCADESVDLILTDPPYGIDVANEKADLWSNTHDFDDSEYATISLLRSAAKEFFRTLRPNRHAYVFFDMRMYTELIKIFSEAGFSVFEKPIIWDKTVQSTTTQPYTFMASYEAILHCMKGQRRLEVCPRDVLPFKRPPKSIKIHPNQKPEDLLTTLINTCTHKSEVVLDPFAGSGSTYVAALKSGRYPIGMELSESIYGHAMTNIQTAYKRLYEVGKQVEDAEEYFEI